MRLAIRSYKLRLAIIVLYVLLMPLIAGWRVRSGAGRASGDMAGELILSQAESRSTDTGIRFSCRHHSL